MVSLDITKLARNRKDAMRSEYWPHLYATEKVGLAALNELKTGVLAARSEVPKAVRVLKGRGAYYFKKGNFGVLRFQIEKVRCTVMDCFQTAGVDYAESLAPGHHAESFAPGRFQRLRDLVMGGAELQLHFGLLVIGDAELQLHFGLLSIQPAQQHQTTPAPTHQGEGSGN